ncbi:hypothetical protein SRABI96_00739 [Peribacillus sp. Bi96]|uniref:hypothetical protein n=1 Tax=unclassified Peribacillus TaxID=2675266 RepID=UPI001DFCF68D|nr:hypothetical protein [Peribacillus sp. Bi96]CAH0152085.1 hypothetical protein SRABI96_00739 [Peribacillus sp. Bi96]
MNAQKIAGLSMMEWKDRYPLLKRRMVMDEVFLMNPDYASDQENTVVQKEQVKAAEGDH